MLENPGRRAVRGRMRKSPLPLLLLRFIGDLREGV